MVAIVVAPWVPVTSPVRFPVKEAAEPETLMAAVPVPSFERLIAALCTEEVRDMELSSPAADVTLLATDVFVPTFSLVAV